MAQYTPVTDFGLEAAGYTPGPDFDFRTATEFAAVLDALLLARQTLQGSLGAAVVKAMAVSAGLDALLSPALLQAVVDGAVAAPRAHLLDADAAMVAAMTRLADLDAGLSRPVALDASGDGALAQARNLDASVDAVAVAGRVLSAALDAGLFHAVETRALSALLDGLVVRTVTQQAGVDALVWRQTVLSAYAGASVARARALAAAGDADLLPPLYWRTLTAAVSAWCSRWRRLAAFPDTVLLGQSTLERALTARLDALIEPGDDMSLSFSTGLRNHLLGYYAHGNGDGLGGAMHNCFIDVYRGEKPASPDFPPVYGTYLGTFQLSENPYNSEWGGSWTDPWAGSIRKQSWQNWVMQGMADGPAGWFRMRLIDDLNDYSITAHRIDGTIGPDVGQYDLVMRDVNVVLGGSYRIESFVMTMRQEQ